MRAHWCPSDIESLPLRGAWFKSLPSELKRELFALRRVKRYPRGAMIYVEGDPPPGLMATLEGAVSFSKIRPSGNEIIYHVAGPGTWFGMFGVLTGLPMMLDVTAVTDVTLICVPREPIAQLLAREPRHLSEMARLPLERFAEALDIIEHVSRPNAVSRMAAKLLALRRLQERSDAAAAAAPLRISQRELAGLTALSRQAVSQVLHDLVAARAVTVGFKAIGILDLERLERIASAPN
jgi:CRP/FNR family transcriptional regulator, cyclic AMP receptor protein